MRDNPAHSAEMLGGAWETDLTRQQARSEWEYALKLILNDPMAYTWRRGYGQDQVLLGR